MFEMPPNVERDASAWSGWVTGCRTRPACGKVATTVVPGWPITVTGVLAVAVPEGTMMLVLPDPVAVTTPVVALTVATAGSPLLNVNAALGTGLLFASNAAAVTVAVWPTFNVGIAGLVMATRETPPTVPVAVNVSGVATPLTVAVSVLAPIA